MNTFTMPNILTRICIRYAPYFIYTKKSDNWVNYGALFTYSADAVH